jgi:nucleotide-binding universal stress UspA family protein
MTAAGRVIVGVHGSLASLAALRFGVTHARRTRAPLHAVLAWAPPEGLTGAQQGHGSAVLTEIWTNHARQRLQEAFDQAFGGIPTDIDLHTHLIRGRPGPVLTALADHPDDLLVIGSSHRRLHSPVRRHCTTRNQCTLILAPLPPLAHSPAARRKHPLQWSSVALFVAALRRAPPTPAHDLGESPCQATDEKRPT